MANTTAQTATTPETGTFGESLFFVFVYGTLKKGFPNHHVMERAKGVLVSGDAEMSYVRMHSVGGAYPALIEDHKAPPRYVKGELWLVQDLAPLDRLEGYDPKDQDNSLYLRSRRTVRYNVAPDRPIIRSASVYIWNRPHADLPIVESGEWK
jgi:gamma-glutamylcyclotransferase (GGCT)/AIG2-like uncharacterized protein YtfP